MSIGYLSVVYGAVAVLSVLLLLFYILWECRKERHFLFLFLCVAFVNIGYFLLSVSKSLAAALTANGIAYFGTAYSLLLEIPAAYVLSKKQYGWLVGLFFALASSAQPFCLCTCCSSSWDCSTPCGG